MSDMASVLETEKNPKTIYNGALGIDKNQMQVFKEGQTSSFSLQGTSDFSEVSQTPVSTTSGKMGGWSL